MRLFKAVLLSSAGVLILACSAPINIPSIPPIVIPSIPPINIPTAEGGGTGGFCALVTAAEMGQALGQTMSVTADEASSCTYTAAQILPSIVIRSDSGETIETGKLITSNGRDLTIGGNRAYYGEFMGSLLWIEKGGRTLTIQAIWSLEGDQAVQTISRVGEIAVARF